jgi:nucleotide-binding universal stress UspA family protein
MFKNILIPTDGSRLAARGVKTGVALAKKLGARVTGVYVQWPYLPPMYGEAALYATYIDEKAYRKASEAQAKKALAGVEAEARKAGVRCTTRSPVAAQAADAILKEARQAGCDAIAMATHGRSGVGGLILGSVAQKVIAGAKVPVVVTR